MILNLRRNPGFSLVEMLVAVAIVGIAVPPLITTYVRSLQSSIAAEDRATAMSAAEWKLADYISRNYYDEMSDEEGSFDEEDVDGAFDNFDYEITVTETTGALDEFQIKKIGICVEFDDVLGTGRRTINHSDPADCEHDYLEIVSETSLEFNN